MRVLYLDCSSGINKESVMGALLDIAVDRDFFLKEMQKLKISSIYDINIFKSACGDIDALKTEIISKHDESITKDDIFTLISDSDFSEKIKDKIIKVFTSLLSADENIFDNGSRENLDMLIYTTGIFVLLNIIKPDLIMSSNICQNKSMRDSTVDALLSDARVPVKYTDENCNVTPLGAAIILCAVLEYGFMPCMDIIKVGYGTGKKDKNIFRAILGSTNNGLSEIAFSFEAEIFKEGQKSLTV